MRHYTFYNNLISFKHQQPQETCSAKISAREDTYIAQAFLTELERTSSEEQHSAVASSEKTVLQQSNVSSGFKNSVSRCFPYVMSCNRYTKSF